MVGLVSGRTRMPPSAPGPRPSGVYPARELGARDEALRAAQAAFEEAGSNDEATVYLWLAGLLALVAAVGASC